MTPLAKLSILSGSHKGACPSLGSSDIAIGSSLDADIILTDPSIAPMHARLSCGYFALEIRALDAAVVAGGKEVAPGESLKLAYPARFRLGDVEAECAGGQGDVIVPGISNAAVIAAAFGVLLILAAGLAVPSLQRAANGSARYSGTAEDAAKLPGSRQAGNSPTIISTNPNTTETAILALRERLTLAGLQSIQVSAEDGIARARGNVTQAQEEAWRGVELWFDSAFGQQIMLQAEVAISAPKIQNSPISIQAVWAGNKPYLIDDHGDKYFEGSLLRDRWVVEKIENKRVILRRNDEILSLEL
jgi:type III secretion protein D